MENEKEEKVSIPDTLVILTIQSELNRLVSTYPLSVGTWKLLLDNFMHDFNTMYHSQVAKDKDMYTKQQQELSDNKS